MGLEYQVKKKDKIQKKKRLNRKQQEFVEESLHEVELAEQGKIKLKSREDLKKEMAFPK